MCFKYSYAATRSELCKRSEYGSTYTYFDTFQMTDHRSAAEDGNDTAGQYFTECYAAFTYLDIGSFVCTMIGGIVFLSAGLMEEYVNRSRVSTFFNRPRRRGTVMYSVVFDPSLSSSRPRVGGRARGRINREGGKHFEE